MENNSKEDTETELTLSDEDALLSETPKTISSQSKKNSVGNKNSIEPAIEKAAMNFAAKLNATHASGGIIKASKFSGGITVPTINNANNTAKTSDIFKFGADATATTSSAGIKVANPNNDNTKTKQDTKVGKKKQEIAQSKCNCGFFNHKLCHNERFC